MAEEKHNAERIAKLEAELVNLDKKIDTGFTDLKDLLNNNYRQMENLVNNGLHQAQNIAHLSKEQTDELKPKIDRIEHDMVDVKLKQAESYSNEQIDDKINSINKTLETISAKLSGSILKQSSLVIAIGVVVYLINNPNILKFLMGE